MLMVALGILIVVIAGVWALAFQMGQKKRESDLGLGQWANENGAAMDNGNAPQGPTPSPAPPKPDGGSGNQARKPDPVKPTPAPAPSDGNADPRVVGLNYLYLGSVTQKDAISAVNFLGKNGVQAFYVFDRKKPSGNNPPCRIYASKGFLGGEKYSESEQERKDLVDKVEALGKRWQREEKGPIDFRQPLWTLFKG